MGSDLARISFDPTRDYRSVVAQQGRVTLEADINEEAMIASEALRLETIDIVGPTGTPDPSGYVVSYDSTKGLMVSLGTMYVGGWRMTLDAAVAFGQQPDWLSRPAAYSGAHPVSRKFIAALLAIEQSVSATEDPALREVGLGGPDTTARTRLMQHFVLIPTSESVCAAAGEDMQTTLTAEGLLFEPATAALTFDASLKVSFYSSTKQKNSCCPNAQGGYLGADNQLVQVAVSEFSAPSGKLLWGWNNASFLYRATAVDNMLQLAQAPVDDAHTPQPGQTIEILQTDAVLDSSGDGSYIAAPRGTIVTLGTGNVYDPSTLRISLPSGTKIPSDSNTLFVRLWQGHVGFTSGVKAHLDDASGLQVLVTIKALPSNQLESRPFWCFAVRPNTPQQAYPARYMEKAQAPDGPRQWLTRLALVESIQDSFRWNFLTDCRIPFQPLTSQTNCDCCEITLSPCEDWLTKLTNALTGTAKAVNICFQPGEYDLSNTITVNQKSVKMTGSGVESVLKGESLEVVLEFVECSVVMSDLSIIAGTAGYSNNPATTGLQGAVTLKSCSWVDFERTYFECADADLRSASCLASYNLAYQPGAIGLEMTGLRVVNCQFLVGHCQVGILVVNAGRTQIEGNMIMTILKARDVKAADLATNKYLSSRLCKQLLSTMTIENTAPPATKKATRRELRKQERSARTTVPTTAPAKAPPPANAPAEQGAKAPAAAARAATGALKTALPIKKLSEINVGALGLAHVNATFGNFKVQFLSSQKLGSAWNDALRTSGLTQTSTAREIHRAVHKIANAVFNNPKSVPATFTNWVNEVLPQLYSTSGQGIVIGGVCASDIRILNNSIDGTVQGIHVGLGNAKSNPQQFHVKANQVQIRGNTINIRLTPEMTGDRHGIYMGCVTSGIISDNHITLSRYGDAGRQVFAIKVSGPFGIRMLIERNAMIGFSRGLNLLPGASFVPAESLWKASDNASDSPNLTGCFTVESNVP